ncbi:MAG: N-acetylmuramoyl-L-alanine amidase [Deltaproteobacteria bacterium]|nr:N-acetylmuramoyl-L-alanine amidase [Deltaproteobacteria bacterium]
MRTQLRGLSLCLALGLFSCAPSAADHARAVAQEATSLGSAIELASSRFGVPREVLLALSYAETEWRAPVAQDEHAGERGSPHAGLELGPMHLRHGHPYDALGRALALLQVDQAALERSMPLQVSGAAAVLAELGAQTGATADRVDSWASAVGRFSGLDGPSVQADYVRRVWDGIRQGLRGQSFTGEMLEVSPHAGPTVEELMGVSQQAQFSTDYGPARWVQASTSNFSASRTGTVQFVVIHTMQGSYAGSISWFQNPMAMASAHYNIRSSDGEVTQMVRESANAWHGGNSYYNNNSVGIEHEGYVADPGRWYTDAMYQSSARLTRMLCDRYRIPIDRQHIIGHYQIPTSGSGAPCASTATTCGGAGRHQDPGNGWNWDRFLTLVRNNGAVTPPAPEYAATYVTSSYPMDAVSGTRPVAWVEYRNTGSATWDVVNTRLGTTQPRDRASRFFDSVNWVNATRPSPVDRATATNTVGRFSFVLNIPTVTTPTVITESFGLVQEGRTWFGPADDTVTFRIRVTPVAGADAGASMDASTPDAEAPAADVEETTDASSPEDVLESPDAGAVADAGGGDASASDAGRRDGRVGSSESEGGCGCRTAGRNDARGGALGLSMAALAGVLAARRRRRP